MMEQLLVVLVFVYIVSFFEKILLTDTNVLLSVISPKLRLVRFPSSS